MPKAELIEINDAAVDDSSDVDIEQSSDDSLSALTPEIEELYVELHEQQFVDNCAGRRAIVEVSSIGEGGQLADGRL